MLFHKVFESNSGVLITHSWRNDLDEPICKEAAAYFHKRGFNVLQFSLPGHGDGGKLRDLSYTSAVEMVTSAAEYMHKTMGVETFYGFGISLGSAAIAFNTDINFKANALLSYAPLVNPRGLYERYESDIKSQISHLNFHDFVELSSASGRGTFEMGGKWITEMRDDYTHYQNLIRSNEIPSIMVQGIKDPFFDASVYGEFLSSLKNKNPVFIEGADHNFTRASDRAKVLTLVGDFFLDYERLRF